MFLLLLWAANYFLPFDPWRLRHSDGQYRAYFAQMSRPPSIHYYRHEGVQIRYLDSGGPDSLPVAIILHGSPSSSSMIASYFEDTLFTQKVRLLAPDRPGYGNSNFGHVERSAARQAQLLGPLVERFASAPRLTVMGSSYGGTVAARLAMIYPDIVDHLVLVSASVAPGEEKIYGVSWFIDRAPFRWFFPTVVQVANDEKLSHRRALEEILPDWAKIRCPVDMLHGGKDELIYPSNVDFAREKLRHVPFTFHSFPERAHNVFFRDPDSVKSILVKR